MSNTLIIPNADFSVNKLTTVTFGTVPCTAISLSSNSQTLTTLGATTTLTATLTPANTTDTLSWSSSDDTVASVADGVITAVKIGTATITATCGEQTANCTVKVNVVPDYVVIGGGNPRKTSGSNALIDVIKDPSGNATKYGAIGWATTDTSVRTLDRVGDVIGNYRLCPIPLPAGAGRVKIESKMYSGQTLLTLKTRFTWFDSTKKASYDYPGAKCLAGAVGASSWDQDSFASSAIVSIPETEGIDSFACAVFMSDWSLAYNTDYKQYFDVTILPPST